MLDTEVWVRSEKIESKETIWKNISFILVFLFENKCNFSALFFYLLLIVGCSKSKPVTIHSRDGQLRQLHAPVINESLRSDAAPD